MDEDVLGAILGLNKTIALGGIEPFNCACRHSKVSRIVATSRSADWIKLLVRENRLIRAEAAVITGQTLRNLSLVICKPVPVVLQYSRFGCQPRAIPREIRCGNQLRRVRASTKRSNLARPS